MTQQRAVTVLIIGCVLLLGACAMFARTALQYFAPDVAATLAVDSERGIGEDTLELAPGSRARLVYQVRIATNSVQEAGRGDDVRYVGRYEFPLHYTVRDSAGAILAEETRTLDWRQVEQELAQSIKRSAVARTGGTLELESALRSFDVPDDGKVSVSASLAPDTVYGARAEALSVRVEHGLHDPLMSIAFAVILLAFGVVTAVIGFVFVVTQTASALSADDTVTLATDAAARQVASACHLAGFAGYLVPLGGLVVPLVVWVLNRRRHPYIDEQGKEAINFQLTVFVFALLSLALVLVVIGFVLLPMLVVWNVVFIIVAALRAWEGKAFRYPLTVRFVH